jgi:DNA-directed RNA polymerase specialized sigma subunit
MNNVDQLIKEHKKLIDLEAARYATNLPLIAVKAEAYKLAKEAAKTYNPASGNKFSTHLVNNLKKLSRMSTQYGSIVRNPENVQFGYNKIQKTEKDLEHTLGRPATVEEIAHHTGFSIKATDQMLQSKKSVTGLSNLVNAPTYNSNQNEEWMAFVYHDLSEKDKLIFEHKTGYGNKPILSNIELAKKLNISQATLSNRLKIINKTLEKGWK